MRLDVTNVSPLAITVSISNLTIATLVENASERGCVTAMVEIPDGHALRVHRVHWELRSATLAFTVAALLGPHIPCAATLVRQDDFGMREPGAKQAVQSVAEKFRKVGEAPANNFFNLPP